MLFNHLSSDTLGLTKALITETLPHYSGARTLSFCGSYPADCAAAEYVFMTIPLHETIKTAIKV